MREQFERWAEEVGALPWGHLKKLRTATGDYSVPVYTYMWRAVQAKPIFFDELACEMAGEILNIAKEPQLGGDNQLHAKIQSLIKEKLSQQEFEDKS